MGKKILVSVPFTKEQREKLEEAAREYGDQLVYAEDRDAQLREIGDADAVIGNVKPDVLAGAKHLSWIQLNTAGADAYVRPGAIPEDTVLTCATGSYGTALSEYLVCMLLVMMKKIPKYLENQKQGVWRDEGTVTTPAGKRILLVGTGDIGLSFAKRIRAFDLPDHRMTLVGIRRRANVCPEPLDEIHPMEDLSSEAAKADVIVLSLPGTPATFHLFDREMLSSCKEGAYLLNIGRGSVVDTKVLLDPRISGRFAGIYLDVCEKEPLPDGDPLFSVPNLYITPHISGKFHLDITRQRISEIALHNYRAWHGDEAFESVVNRSTGYAD